MPKHAINWFEIPVTDMDRAVAFYEAMLGVTMERMTVGTPVAVFPHDEGGVGGALSLDGREAQLRRARWSTSRWTGRSRTPSIECPARAAR